MNHLVPARAGCPRNTKKISNYPAKFLNYALRSPVSVSFAAASLSLRWQTVWIRSREFDPFRFAPFLRFSDVCRVSTLKLLNCRVGFPLGESLLWRGREKSKCEKLSHLHFVFLDIFIIEI